MEAVSGLFESLNSIAFYTQVGAFTNSEEIEGTLADFGVSGIGAEALLDLPGLGETDFELGLGTSILRGFEATEPTLDLRGTLRTLPSIAVYASGLGVPDDAAVSPYLGVNFGILELWNAQGFDADGNVYAVAGETYELGATAGFYLEKTMFRGLYFEASYRVRDFESVTWSAEQLPEGWPRAFDASGWNAIVGWQFRIEDEGEGGE